MLILQLLGLVMSGPAAPILKNYLGIGFDCDPPQDDSKKKGTITRRKRPGANARAPLA